MLPDQAVYSNLKASALVLSRTNLFCLPPWQRGHHACLAPRCLGMWRCLSKFFQWNGWFFCCRNSPSMPWPWYSFLDVYLLAFWRICFWSDSRHSDSSPIRWLDWLFGSMTKAQTALHIAEKMVPGVGIKACRAGGWCLVRVGLTDARPGRWLLRDPQAELPTGGFLDVGWWRLFPPPVGGDPTKPGSRYDIFLDIRQGVESVWSTTWKWNNQLPSTVEE